MSEPTKEDVERHYRLLLRRGVPEKHAKRLAHGRWIGIGLNTNTSFSARLKDDGFGDDNRSRQIAKRRAEAAGVSTAGKYYETQLCRKGVPFDPGAWVDHSTARDDIRKKCEMEGWGCRGDINVKRVVPDEPGPFEKPYEVAPDLVNAEVERVIQEEAGGERLPEKEHRDLVETTKERLLSLIHI